ncbi:MAG: hypothetical protein ACXAEU_19120 [Candidatus Hodarchaeales archaeon]
MSTDTNNDDWKYSDFILLWYLLTGVIISIFNYLIFLPSLPLTVRDTVFPSGGDPFYVLFNMVLSIFFWPIFILPIIFDQTGPPPYNVFFVWLFFLGILISIIIAVVIMFLDKRVKVRRLRSLQPQISLVKTGEKIRKERERRILIEQELGISSRISQPQPPTPEEIGKLNSEIVKRARFHFDQGKWIEAQNLLQKSREICHQQGWTEGVRYAEEMTQKCMEGQQVKARNAKELSTIEKGGFKDRDEWLVASNRGFSTISDWKRAQKVKARNAEELSTIEKGRFKDRDEWLEASNRGFSTASDWKRARKAGIGTYRDYQEHLDLQKVQEVLLKLRPNIPVQMSRIVSLTGLQEGVVERILQYLCRDKDIGEYLSLEQVFIRSSPEDRLLEEAFKEWSILERKKRGKN